MDDAMDQPLTPEELSVLPVFPLPRVVFFPGSVLPLHVFEPRYRAMMEDCVSTGPRAIAVAMLAPGWEDDYEGRPPIHPVAGVGRIADWHRRPDGRFDVALHGLHRVRLEELPPEGRAYRRARATVLPDRVPHPAAVERAVDPLLAAATSLVATVRREHPQFELGLSPGMSPGRMADRIADRVIADVDERQRLLEQADVKVRLAILTDRILEILAAIATREGQVH